MARIDKILPNGRAIVELGQVRKTIELGLLTDDIKIGEWVLVHTGFAISKIDEEKAQEILSAYQEIEELELENV